MNTFDFYRWRFQFRALDATYFPRAKSGNIIRGAFGLALQGAAPAGQYERLFEPRAQAAVPSGFRDLPRPFVFRTAHLDGQTLDPGEIFWIDVHFFDVLRPALLSFETAFASWKETGIGPRRGRVELEAAVQLDPRDQAAPGPNSISLEADPQPIPHAVVRFITPTELKTAGGLAERPEFHILFARIRDRVSALRKLYGAAPVDIDFRGLGQRARAVELSRFAIEWDHIDRRSSRTRQTHPIGGFIGDAEYVGELAEFAPWLRVARWTGVGRQTVWGKGDVRCDC